MRTVGSYAASGWIGSGDAFADALGFTESDLAENRRGRIPFSQASRVWKRAIARLALPVTVFVLLGSIGSVLGLLSIGVLTPMDVFGPALWFGWEPPMLYMPLFALVAIALSVGVFYEVWFGIGQLLRLRRDLAAGKAVITEGFPRFSSELVIGPNLSARCWLVLNNVHFEVPSSVPMTLPTRGPCRIYHTPGSRLVLSVESR
jgi:hypothetical protein